MDYFLDKRCLYNIPTVYFIYNTMGYTICCRCHVRYFQKYNYKLLRRTQDEIATELGCLSDVDSNNHQELICVACLNILNDDVINKCICDVITEAGKYTFESFRINILQPVQLIVCNKLATHELTQKPTNRDKDDLCNYLEVKDAFKSILEPLLESKLNSKCDADASLEINIAMKHQETETNVLNALEAAVPDSFKHAKMQLDKQSRKRQRDDLTYFTIASVTSAVSRLNDDDLAEMLKVEHLQNSAEIGNITTLHKPLMVGGRYMKYSRVLSQTPWLIDGVRKSEMSVEEYLTGPILDQYEGDGCNFSSSGREDCDVRMLGEGRPFIVEVVNPRKFSTDDGIVKSVQEKINCATKDIQIQNLQVITKKDQKTLKEGEESKTKTYSAYCIVKVENHEEESVLKEVKDKLLSLSDMKNLTINQKTPLRVLHRRSLSVRPRIIENMSVQVAESEILNKDKNKIFFKLTLTTQAGTYIKEFVHGDFGRTVPNLCELLGHEVDIINLDVESVNINWP